MTEKIPDIQHRRSWNGLSFPPAGMFTMDPTDGAVSFIVPDLGDMELRGRFRDAAAALRLGEDPLDSSIQVTIRTASLTTGHGDRDALLRSRDFFDADAHPLLTFRSTAITHLTGNEFVLAGDLTIKGLPKPIELRGSLDGVGVDPWGAQVLGFSARAEVHREEWGLTWGVDPHGDAGGRVVVDIDAQFNRVRSPTAAPGDGVQAEPSLADTE